MSKTRTRPTTWKAIVASSLDWEQAHVSFDRAVERLAPADRTRRPKGQPHSVWDLVEHIRIAQRDLLDFCTNPRYAEVLKWPDDYWPTPTAKPSDRQWKASLAAIRRDRRALARFTTGFRGNLAARIPHGTGQTYLRTILVAVDHAAYHTGQIVLVRRLMGRWTH
ncbi:MAG: DinB family protein [Vicinamibacterales bacterium]